MGSDIFLDLYHCPAEPARWRHVLDQVCNKVGVVSAVVQEFRQSRNSIRQTWAVRDTASERDAALHDRLVNNDTNPRLDPRISRPCQHNVVVRDSDRFNADCPHWAALRARLREAGLGDSIGVGTPDESGASVAIVLHRHHADCRPFSDDDEQYLRELLPHVANAVALGRRLEHETRRARRMESIADSMRLGVLTFDRERNISWANEAAQEILGRSPHLHEAGGRLRVPFDPRYGELEIFLQNSVSFTAIAPASVVLGANEEDELHIALLSPELDSGEEVALLMSEPRRTPAPAPENIARVLCVTPAEGRVAAALCAGKTLKEYAQIRGISEGSARNQLKQVLAKTETGRQSELVGHLWRSVIFQLRSQRRPDIS